MRWGADGVAIGLTATRPLPESSTWSMALSDELRISTATQVPLASAHTSLAQPPPMSGVTQATSMTPQQPTNLSI